MNKGWKEKGRHDKGIRNKYIYLINFILIVVTHGWLTNCEHKTRMQMALSTHLVTLTMFK